jgi:hypothetical protein
MWTSHGESTSSGAPHGNIFLCSFGDMTIMRILLHESSDPLESILSTTSSDSLPGSMAVHCAMSKLYLSHTIRRFTKDFIVH